MVHPTRKLIESLHEKGTCVRLQLDATHEGVSCPDFLREQWKEELVIDLDPSWPLNLAFTDDGIEADLAFDGYVERCTFPFAAIYVTADRETGDGIVVDQNMPPSVRAKRGTTQKPPTTAERLAQGKGERRSNGSRRRKRPRPEPQLAPTPEVAEVSEVVEAAAQESTTAQSEAAPETDSKPDTTETDSKTDSKPDTTVEQEAKRRRSAFQVIDGDG